MNRNTFIVPPVDADFDYFQDNLCQADKDELKQVAGIKPKNISKAIKGYFMNSYTCNVLIDAETNEPMAIFGCISKELEPTKKGETGHIVGYPWMLTTGNLSKYPQEIFKLSKAFIESAAENFSYLHVVASEDHPFSVPFLEKLGFKKDTTIDVPGIKGVVLIRV